MFDVPFLKVPIGSKSDSNDANKENNEESDYKKKEKEILDKKVDDAIKKAWEEK